MGGTTQPAGQAEIAVLAAAALESYEFSRRSGDFRLVRRHRSSERAERLVDGLWITVRRGTVTSSSSEWKKLGTDELERHVRRYLLDDPAAEGVGWRTPWDRMRRSMPGRWVFSPLKGGSSKRLARGVAKRSRRAYAEQLSEATGNDLRELKEEVLLGYEHQRERITGIEQRATFFLGAAGLTTSLVLANAGLLLGDDKLGSPWLGLAIAALAVASVCAIAAGVRAMQATMITFVRTPPNAVTTVVNRRGLKGDALLRAYVGALLVAQARAGVIGDWKVRRLASARRWFVAAIVGVVVLTAFVLVDALP